jgi:hypothetical protein
LLISQICGFFALFFVVFCAIWSIPEERESISEYDLKHEIIHELREKAKEEAKEEATGKNRDNHTYWEKIDLFIAKESEKPLKDEETEEEYYVKKMLKDGFVLNTETQKWEKPKPKTGKGQNGLYSPEIHIDFKKEIIDESTEKGYVLNLETGKWEKPKIAEKEAFFDKMLEDGYVFNTHTGKWEKPKD